MFFKRDSMIVALDHISIGNRVLIGERVSIRDHDHAFKDISVTVIERSYTTSPITIGDTWLGCNVVVLKGVNIGKRVIVGASSVVTHDIPDYSVAVGIPAKVVKRLMPSFDGNDAMKTIE